MKNKSLAEYIIEIDVITHEFNNEGQHRLIVNDVVGDVIGGESICMLKKYMALHSDLSPEKDSMVLHLNYGKLKAVGMSRC